MHRTLPPLELVSSLVMSLFYFVAARWPFAGAILSQRQERPVRREWDAQWPFVRPSSSE